MSEPKIYNPGSDTAIAQGCLCPVLDSGRGVGYMGGAKGENGKPMFWINSACSVHGSLNKGASDD